MQWLGENWLFVLIAVGMVVMHLFGHGGHGAHGGHGGGGREDEDRKARKDDEPPAPGGGHRH